MCRGTRFCLTKSWMSECSPTTHLPLGLRKRTIQNEGIRVLVSQINKRIWSCEAVSLVWPRLWKKMKRMMWIWCGIILLSVIIKRGEYLTVTHLWVGGEVADHSLLLLYINHILAPSTHTTVKVYTSTHLIEKRSTPFSFAVKLTAFIYLIHLLCCDCMHAAIRKKSIFLWSSHYSISQFISCRFHWMNSFLFLTHLLLVVEDIII